jgi:hypothetical protein
LGRWFADSESPALMAVHLRATIHSVRLKNPAAKPFGTRTLSTSRVNPCPFHLPTYPLRPLPANLKDVSAAEQPPSLTASFRKNRMFLQFQRSRRPDCVLSDVSNGKEENSWPHRIGCARVLRGSERSRSCKRSPFPALADGLCLRYLSSPSLPEDAGTGGFTDTSVPVSTQAL